MPKIKEYPDFKPNITPKQMFKLGSFGGTYWRPIKSSVINKDISKQHIKFKELWWSDLNENKLSSEKYKKSINKYKVKVGSSLEFWESKDWISTHDPYGWVQWYCNFEIGRRIPEEDKRQIKRWKGLAGKNGRFRKWLITQIIKKNGKWNDNTISPKIRQTLQHWGYRLTKSDFDKEINNRNKKNKQLN